MTNHRRGTGPGLGAVDRRAPRPARLASLGPPAAHPHERSFPPLMLGRFADDDDDEDVLDDAGRDESESEGMQAAGDEAALGAEAMRVLANAKTLASVGGNDEDEGGGVVAPPSESPEPFVATPELLRFCEPFDPSHVDAGAELGTRRRLKVALLLSGGVDSSVALTLLKAAGHEVTAFYLQIWFQEDFRNYWDQCPWEDDLKVAQEVCDVLDVPLQVVPLTNQYWDLVVSHSIGEIANGRTPNPDMLCNSRVKFGAFREYLHETYPGVFDRIASGHYAAMDRADNEADAEKPVKLVMSGDAHKDQTYFLAHLSQTQLAQLSFPIGGLPKSQIREIAAAAGLPNAGRKDSQGICFLGKVKFSEFVAEHLGERPGPIVELETGDELGTHRGFWFHTIGQRSGLGLSHGPWYVCAKDTDANVVYVTRDYYSVDKERNTFRVGAFNWIGGCPPPAPGGWVMGYGAGSDEGAADEEEKRGEGTQPRRRSTSGASAAAVAAAVASELYCKVRHGEKRYRCTLKFDAAEKEGSVVIDSHDQGLAAGQFAVFYDGETCLGCGVILEQPRPARPSARDAEHSSEAAGTV